MDGKNRGWVLESYPVGNDFDAALKLRDTAMPEPGRTRCWCAPSICRSIRPIAAG